MDILRLYQDFSVDHRTEGHKHCRPGWVNVECPWCVGEHAGYHLGFELQDEYFFCWRCGWHPIIPTLSLLLKIKESEAKHLVKLYGGNVIFSIQKKEPIVRTKAHRLPSNTGPLQKNHIRYLEGRGFDPDYISKEWKVTGTGPFSKLDNLDFRFRLIIPIIWNSEEVSFTSRDITEKTEVRYLTCPKDRELINHKNILYGKQERWGSTGICVEGPTDVWRFRTKAFGTFGIKYTNTQVRLITKLFKRVAVAYDDEPQAVQQALSLVADLKFRGVDAFRVPIVGDPGGMSQEEADYLVKQIIH